jgi:hypothetical protein
MVLTKSTSMKKIKYFSKVTVAFTQEHEGEGRQDEELEPQQSLT